MLNRIQKTINIIDDYIDTMYKDYGDGIKKLPEIVKEIQEIMVEFLNKLDITINMEKIYRQM